MHNNLPPEAHHDCFRPPSIPTEVWCLHCQKIYESYLMEWRESRFPGGERRGFWCCPMPGCGGAGFGFDIYPTDPDYVDPDGRDVAWDDDDEELDGWDEEEGDELVEEFGDLPPIAANDLPPPRRSRRLDGYFGPLDEDEDIPF